MGRACAFALATAVGLNRLTLVDLDRSRAEYVARWLADHTACHVVPTDDLELAITGQDALALALPWAATRQVIDAAGPAGVPVASITRPPYHELSELDALAGAGAPPVLLPIGLEPGLTELLAAHLAERLDRTDSLEIFCGGVPQRPREPIGYVAFFGGEQADHLPIAQRDALACREGRPVTLPRFSGLEHRRFDDIGQLQAYHDGMVPWLPRHPALGTADCVQKTVRWPGFAEAVTELARLGLLDEKPVDVDGVLVSPRRLTEKVLAPRLRPGPGDADMVLLDVTARGLRDGQPTTLHTRLTDFYDPATRLSAMARTTGFTLAEATRLLATGAIQGSGWQMPHVALGDGLRERLLRSLTGHGIRWVAPLQTVSSQSAVPERAGAQREAR